MEMITYYYAHEEEKNSDSTELIRLSFLPSVSSTKQKKMYVAITYPGTVLYSICNKKNMFLTCLHRWKHCLVHDFKNILIKKMVYRSLFIIHFRFLCWWFFKAACCFFFCFILSGSFIPLVVTCNNCSGNCHWIIGCRVRSGDGIIGVLITRADHDRCRGFIRWILCERRSTIIQCVCGAYCRILFIGRALGTLVWALVRFLARSAIKTMHQYFTQIN